MVWWEVLARCLVWLSCMLGQSANHAALESCQPTVTWVNSFPRPVLKEIVSFSAAFASFPSRGVSPTPPAPQSPAQARKIMKSIKDMDTSRRSNKFLRLERTAPTSAALPYRVHPSSSSIKIGGCNPIHRCSSCKDEEFPANLSLVFLLGM